MVSDHSQPDTRQQVLDTIRTASTPPTVAELAQSLDMHPNSIRLHTAALRRTGLVTQEGRSDGRRGRPLTTYRTTARGARSGRRDYEMLAAVLVANLRDSADNPATEARRAGHRWGSQIATQYADPSSRVVEVLDELGFEPDQDPDTVRLRNCPFRELVDSEGLVCSLHAGMLEGLVETEDVNIELLPFVSDSVCAVHMTSA